MFSEPIIGGRTVSINAEPFIIAEISANHNGSLKTALETISMAKVCGADAVKMQSYTADTLTINSNKDDFLIKSGLWAGRSLYDLYSEAYTPFNWHETIFEHAEREGILLFSTPFDESSVDLLESLNAPAYKIASFEIVDLPLIEKVAKTNKPLLISTGMASLNEIGNALQVAYSNGCKQLALLHCISSYPASINEANLKSIKVLKKEFGVEVGLSDHTIGYTASMLAISLGASFVEKHFILNRNMGGVDSEFSAEPSELQELIEKTKLAYHALGDSKFKRAKSEEANKVFRRSIYYVANLKIGDLVKEEHIRIIRPGFGLEPKFYCDILGKTLNKNVEPGDRVSFNDFED